LPVAFSSLMIRLAAEMLEHLPPAPTVVELGDRTFSPRGRDLSRVRDRLTRAGRAFDAATLDRLRRLRGAEREVATPDYYGLLGYAAYETIGTDARRDSRAMDVNLDLAQAYGFTRSFDLVTNNGGGAHVFDQHALFANMHRLCRQGGVTVHLAPFIGRFNHGFYSVNPLLFGALAAANRYEILRLAIVNADGTEAAIQGDAVQERASVQTFGISGRLGRGWRLWRGRADGELAEAVLRAVRTGSNLSVLAVLRKTSAAPFAAPVQGRTAGDAIDARAVAVGEAARPAAAHELVGGLTGAAAEG
jgi:SAM-dependent methyltransferase